MNDNLTQVVQSVRSRGVQRVAAAARRYLESVRLRDKSIDFGEVFGHMVNVHRHEDELRKRMLEVLDPTKQPLTEVQPPGMMMPPLEREIHVQLNEHRLPRDLHHAIAKEQLRYLARTTPADRLQELHQDRAKEIMRREKAKIDIEQFLPDHYRAKLNQFIPPQIY